LPLIKADSTKWLVEKRYKAYQSGQSLLFPPNIKDWLAEDHLAYFASDVVDQLDLSAIEIVPEQRPLVEVFNGDATNVQWQAPDCGVLPFVPSDYQ
jgi:hypothetical protein